MMADAHGIIMDSSQPEMENCMMVVQSDGTEMVIEGSPMVLDGTEVMVEGNVDLTTAIIVKEEDDLENGVHYGHGQQVLQLIGAHDGVPGSCNNYASGPVVAAQSTDMDIEHSEAPTKLRRCRQTWISRTEGQEHDRYESEEIIDGVIGAETKRYRECPSCDRKFVRPSFLKRHLTICRKENARRTEGEKSESSAYYMCSFCTETFHTRSQISQHLLSCIHSPYCRDKKGKNKRNGRYGRRSLRTKPKPKEEEEDDEESTEAPVPEAFSSVPSILNPSSRCRYQKRYNITEDEIKRRLGLPEELSMTELNRYLHVNQFHMGALRDFLGRINARCKKTPSEHSALTRLCEGEVTDLAYDLRRLMFKYTLLDKAVEAHTQDLVGERTVTTRRVALKATRFVLNDLMNLMTSQEICNDLSLATHGLLPQLFRTVSDIMRMAIAFELHKLKSS